MPPDELAASLETALTRPLELQPGTVEAVLGALDSEDATRWAPALSTLAGILYARPDLARPAIVDRLAALLGRDTVPDAVVASALIAFEHLATTDLAEPALAALRDLLAREALAPSVRARLVPLLRAYASWRPELLDVHAVVELAAAPVLADHRNTLLGQALEPLVFLEPERFVDAVVDRIVDVFEGCARAAYTLAALAERPGARPSVRRHLAALLADRFPIRPAARAALTGRPFALLAVLNVRIGAGDEIVRLGALTQALLDANPRLHVTLVTKRPYLYDHPRVRPVSIFDDPALDTVLTDRFDGVIHVSEPAVPEVSRRVSWRPLLDARVVALVEAQRPRFVITANIGRSHFVYRTVVIDGRDIARARGLHRLGLESIYDGCRRLLAELGLPARAAEERPRGGCLLTGTPSPDAERIWANLRAGLAAPIALVNAFGGATPMKGYPPDRPERLAADLAGLVGEGYSVVLLPNGTAWGTQEATNAVRAHLPREARARVVVGPDPSEPDPTSRVALTERPDLPYADRIMRLFKYFATYADLVAAVEGWMTHLAYGLGRPFRLVLQAQSFSFDWHPHGRGPHQCLVPALSGGRPGRPRPADGLGAEDPPPLPPRPRKLLLQAALPGLHRCPLDRAIPTLLRALRSEDCYVRAYALSALGPLLPNEDARRSVVGALRDPDAIIRDAAAGALLASGLDWTRELGTGFREYLQAHRDIARQNWAPIFRVGVATLPALFIAASGTDDAICREARWVLGRLLRDSGLTPIAAGHPPSPVSGTRVR